MEGRALGARVVSFDLRIFFPLQAFPAQEWYDLLESFRADDCYVRFDKPANEEQSGIKECSLIADGSLLSIGVYSMRPDSPDLCAPRGTYWNATVSTGMGRSGRALWLQFCIPYHALVLFPGVTVHDCEYHLGRSTAESSWTDPESWMRFSERQLWRQLGSKAELIERGLFNADGTLRF